MRPIEASKQVYHVSTDIVNKIAHLVAQRDLGLKDSKETKRVKDQKGLSTPQDQVTLTSAAKTYASSASSASELEKEQSMKVERLKALVDGGNYKMDSHMVDSIAENIANMLL